MNLVEPGCYEYKGQSWAGKSADQMDKEYDSKQDPKDPMPPRRP